ncbi:MAG: hypothetical protein RSF90_05575, partial [Pygmaiobacter sp.]
MKDKNNTVSSTDAALENPDAVQSTIESPAAMPEEEKQSAATAERASALPSSYATEVGNEKSYLPAPFTYHVSEKEQVSLASGALEYHEADFVLPGKNGFNLAISRIYSSDDAGLYEPKPESYNQTKLRTAKRENRHDLLQYGLGVGWRFALPSIEVVPLSLRDASLPYNDRLRLEDGRKFEITDTNGVLSLKDHPLLDVTIAATVGSLSHPCIPEKTVAYDVIVRYKNGHQDYFKKVMNAGELDHYTLTARADRFGNCIFFNLVPYGGMQIFDTWGRELVLRRAGEDLIWTLPQNKDENPRTLSYETANEGQQLISCTNPQGLVTRYRYCDTAVYSAQSRYASPDYG